MKLALHHQPTEAVTFMNGGRFFVSRSRSSVRAVPGFCTLQDCTVRAYSIRILILRTVLLPMYYA